MFRIKTMNNISSKGLNRFPSDSFEITENLNGADAILVRSALVKEEDIPPSIKAIGRAGAGTNNIPVSFAASGAFLSSTHREPMPTP